MSKLPHISPARFAVARSSMKAFIGAMPVPKATMTIGVSWVSGIVTAEGCTVAWRRGPSLPGSTSPNQRVDKPTRPLVAVHSFLMMQRWTVSSPRWREEEAMKCKRGLMSKM